MSDAQLSPLFTWRSAIASADGPADVELDSGGAVKGSTQRSVALVLSLYMSEKGTSAFPAIATIAEAAGISDRSAQRAILALRRTGWLELVHSGGGRRRATNEYHATVPPAVAWRGEGASPLMPGGVKGLHPRGEGASPDLVSEVLEDQDLLGTPGKPELQRGRLNDPRAAPRLTDERFDVVERILAACRGTDAGSRGVLSSFAGRLHISVLEGVAVEVERSPRHVGSVVKTLKAHVNGAATKARRDARRLEAWLTNIGPDYAHSAEVFLEEIRAVGVDDPDVAEAYRRELLEQQAREAA